MKPARWTFLGVVILVTALDVLLRHAQMAAWSRSDQTEYVLCWCLSLPFWAAAVVLLGQLLRPGGRLPIVRYAAFVIGLTVLTLLCWLPLTVALHYGTFPTRDGMILVATSAKLMSEDLWRLMALRDMVLLAVLLGAIGLAAWANRRLPLTNQSWATAACVALLLYPGHVALASVTGNIPLPADANSIYFGAQLVQWGSHPPRFFELSERYAQPLKPAGKKRSPYNFVFVVGETFGAEYLKAWGGADDPTPQLDLILADPGAIRLERLYANSSSTDVSVPSLLAGLEPMDALSSFLSADLVHDVFKASGFDTSLVSSHSLRWASLASFIHDPELDFMEGAEDRVSDPSDNDGTPDLLTYASALAQMDRSSSQGHQFFAIVQVNTLHPPYQVDPEGPSLGPLADHGVPSPRYLASIRYFDHMFGIFFDALARRAYGPRTIVVFTADHGEAFGQHGIFSHGGKYYEEESHVPGFVFAPPDAWRDPAVAARLTEIRENRGAFLSNIDLFPTLLDLAQIDPAPVRAQLEGYSAARPLPEDRRYLFSNCSDFRRCPIPFFGFYSRGVKYMFHADSKRWEAFDIMADPRDLHDVAATHMAEIGAAMPWLRQHSTAVRLLDGIW